MNQHRTLTQQIFAPRCPKCGEGKLFKNMLDVVDACEKCGLTLKHHDAADGPTFFALVIVGFIVTVGAAVVEAQFEPPMWVHGVLWIPTTLIGCIFCLRAVKAILITYEQRLALLKENDPNA